ncbi:hypothetical protein ACXJJ3_22975 [Kribbella sp. WER1]
MSRFGRRAARFTAAVLAATMVLPAGRALADNEEPTPTAWPTVTVVEQGSAAEPQPVDWPSPPSSDSVKGEATEPQPTDWPSPQQN